MYFYALKNLRNPEYKNVQSWLDRAQGSGMSQKQIDEVKCAASVIIMLIPLFVFWRHE